MKAITITHIHPRSMSSGGIGPGDLTAPLKIQREIVGEEARQAIMGAEEITKDDARANRENGGGFEVVVYK